MSDRKGKKKIERKASEQERETESRLENEISMDSYDPVKVDDKWYKRCSFCGRVFVVKTTKYNQEKYCSIKCKVAKETSQKRHTFVCSNCGKEFSRNYDKHSEHNFCCHKCSEEFSAKARKRPEKVCEICGKSYTSKYDGQRFCSTACQNKWQKINFLGEKNPRYKKEITIEERTKICPICGKIFVAENAYRASRVVYCSMKCKRKAFRNSIVQQELVETIREMRNDLEVEHVEYPFSFDCFVSPSYVIEMMGDYWHCNSTVFGEKDWDNIQKRAYIKDSHKRKFLVENNYKFLYIWEKDWREDKEKCISLIKKLFDDNLEYPDSFNYERKGNEINSSSEIIYFYPGEND